MKFSFQVFRKIKRKEYTFKKLAMAANLKFKVKTNDLLLNATDSVCVSGDVDQLGNWKLEGRLPLKLMKDSQHGPIWQGTVTFHPDTSEIYFRYCITSIINGQLMVRFWESNLKPRKANKNEKNADEDVHQFGFYDCKYSIERGWLISSNVIQLKFFKDFVSIFDQAYQNQSFNIKIVKVKKNDGYDYEVSDDQVLIIALNREESIYKTQSSFGRKFAKGENLVFQTESLETDSETFRVELYTKNSKGQLEVTGIAYTPALKSYSTGLITLPITGVDGQLLIGEIKMEYVIVRPMKTYECDLKNSYVKYWKKQDEPLKIGHRGCGSSFGKIEKSALFNVRENTIGSLKMAGNNGADYVEFDVQLSQDLVPIIYHDFYLCAAVLNKNASENAKLLKLLVQTLSFEEMQNLKIYHVTEKGSDNTVNAKTFLRDDEEEFNPFPTLEKLFSSIDTSLGFNVEIKWDLKYADADLPHQMDMNTYLDVILKTVLENAGCRRIIFSCFHPDVCTMIRWKQNKYPVLLLTQGKTRRYPPYMDPRTNCIDQAINFALSAEILGIDVQTEEILSDNSTVASCLDSGLLMFCWGVDNNDQTNRELLKKLGVHAIIHDRVDQMNS